jgi:prolyl-tRNA editing enzyme YbaK/EbsC (Cys-tRNA(Pro) deacylase)
MAAGFHARLVWQPSHATPVTGMWVGGTPALGAPPLPVWQLAQGVASTAV